VGRAVFEQWAGPGKKIQVEGGEIKEKRKGGGAQAGQATWADVAKWPRSPHDRDDPESPSSFVYARASGPGRKQRRPGTYRRGVLVDGDGWARRRRHGVVQGALGGDLFSRSGFFRREPPRRCSRFVMMAAASGDLGRHRDVG
jgi:hypothetical protein